MTDIQNEQQAAAVFEQAVAENKAAGNLYTSDESPPPGGSEAERVEGTLPPEDRAAFRSSVAADELPGGY